MTGLEFWFDPPAGHTGTAALAASNCARSEGVVFALVLALNLVLGPLIGGQPLTLRLLLTAVIQVGLTTYVVMPWPTPRIACFDGRLFDFSAPEQCRTTCLKYRAEPIPIVDDVT